MNGKPKSLKLSSPFHRATGDRSWHSNFSVPASGRILEYDWRTSLDGENTWRFIAYALKITVYPDRQVISFDIQDQGKDPVKGDGSNCAMTIEMLLE